MIKVDLNVLDSVIEYLEHINKQNLEDIVWARDNKEISINPNALKSYKYTGLSNIYFPYQDDFI